MAISTYLTLPKNSVFSYFKNKLKNLVEPYLPAAATVPYVVYVRYVLYCTIAHFRHTTTEVGQTDLKIVVVEW